MEAERIERHFERHVAHKRDELLREADQRDAFGIGQCFAAFRLFDLASAGEQSFEIAIFGDELRRGLQADAARARHIVGRIAGQRLNIDDFFRAARRNRRRTSSTPILRSSRAPLAPASPEAGSYMATPGPDELHQILVGGNDQNIGTAAGAPRQA